MLWCDEAPAILDVAEQGGETRSGNRSVASTTNQSTHCGRPKPPFFSRRSVHNLRLEAPFGIRSHHQEGNGFRLSGVVLLFQPFVRSA
jgi:hypothetical protein